MRSRRLWIMGLVLAALVARAEAQGTGDLVGVVTGEAGPVSGVTVVVNEVSMAELTDANGEYRISHVPAGTYTVTFSLGDRTATAENVAVEAGAENRLDQTVEWDVSFAETITVFSASRRRERVVEAPAAVTVVSEEEIEREAAHGQVPKLLEATPGAEITQSGLYDFNLNTRGFNSSLNRRVPTLLDGRDPSVPFLMSQDWSALSSLGDIASAELIRGPSSALYGPNAVNGVLNLTTKQPRYSQGGTFRFSGGELSTLRGDARWAGEIGNGTFLKVVGSYTQSDDFYVSRNLTTEYAGLPRERVPVAIDEDELSLANVRLDRYIGNDFLTIEGGYSSIEGPVLQTGIGRVQVLDSTRPWGRVNYSSEHFNVLGYYNKRDAPEQLALASGANLYLNSDVWAVEVQGNGGFAGGKGRIVGGASYRDEEIDTQRTLTFDPVVTGDRQAVYAQVDYAFHPKFKAVVAGRWDDSSLHDSQVSPKVAFVFSPTANQTVRLTYNEAFQSPNYSEYFLYAPTAIQTPGGPISSVNLAPIEAGLCTPFGISCGFATPVGVRALGNENLELEEIKTYELGYSAIFGGKAFLTLDYYQSDLDNFVTDLLPNAFGSINPAFGPYQAPAGHPAPALLLGTLRAALGPLYPFLSTNADGQPIFALASYTNAGSAETEGVDFGLTLYLNRRWNVDLTYSWLDWEVADVAQGDRVLPNSPENQAGAGLSYLGERFDASVSFRWVDEFDWAAGVFFGTVPQYEVVNLSANWRMNDNFRLGLNVSNLLDDEHWEAFGGDILGRRALGSVTFTW